MSKQTMIIVGVIALLIIGISLFAYQSKNKSRSEEVVIPGAEEQLYPVLFKNAEDGSKVEVAFDSVNNTAVLDGMGYNGLILNQVVSASGARYENKNENLIVWNKGSEVTIYKGEEIIFSGMEGK